jgi:hypothetical protein
MDFFISSEKEKLNLQQDPLSLRLFCKQEGIKTLGKSLLRKHPALTQHLCQALDEESGALLLLACQLPESKHTDYHIDQVLEMVKFLQGALT